MQMRSPLILSLWLLLLAPQLSGASPAADERAVWRLEHKYWEYAKANDVPRYLTLWDERFVGWPGGKKSPVGKAEIAGWIAPLHEQTGKQFDYELTQEASRSFHNVVVVHYLVRYFYRSSESGKVVEELGVSRITHTWQRRGSAWRIITGMSAEQSAE
jgi:hypothetical protein